MTINNDLNYLNLYEIWIKEVLSQELQSISLNFFKMYSEVITQLKLDIIQENQLEYVIVKRMQFMLDSLYLLRNKKLMSSIFNKKEINSALLTNSEKFFLEMFSILNKIYGLNSFEEVRNEILDRMLVIFKEDYEKIDNMLLKNNKKNNYIKVRVLKSIPEFIDENNNKYGPLRISEVVELPEEICRNVLIPKSFVEEI